MAILKLTEEVCNEEAAKHQAHREQGSVGVCPFSFQLMNCYIAIWMDLTMLLDDWVERVVQCIIQMFIVQDQRVGFEDLKKRRNRIEYTFIVIVHVQRNYEKKQEDKPNKTVTEIKIISLF